MMTEHCHSDTIKAYSQAQQWSQAIAAIAEAIIAVPELSSSLAWNLDYCRRAYRQQRREQAPTIAVACWELSHNPVGRALTLIDYYHSAGFAKPELLGVTLPAWGNRLWSPLEQSSVTVHYFSNAAEDFSQFLSRAISLVKDHPYDIVHLCKPRGPNLLFAVLYKWLWGSRVIVDIDDEELAFFNKRQVPPAAEMSVAAWLQQHSELPPLSELGKKQWTYFALGLRNDFDAITVSNVSLQQRYGGYLLPHARPLSRLNFSTDVRQQQRQQLGLSDADKVVLFFGTPRRHKGLLETAKALAQLNRADVVLLIIGDFADPEFADEIRRLQGVRTKFMGNQPYHQAAQLVTIGDITVLLQDPSSLVAQYQMPAKISDALAAGLWVLSSRTPPLEDMLAQQAILETSEQTLVSDIQALLERLPQRNQVGLDYFNQHLLCESYQPWFQQQAQQLSQAQGSAPLSAEAELLLSRLLCP